MNFYTNLLEQVKQLKSDEESIYKITHQKKFEIISLSHTGSIPGKRYTIFKATKKYDEYIRLKKNNEVVDSTSYNVQFFKNFFHMVNSM